MCAKWSSHTIFFGVVTVIIFVHEDTVLSSFKHLRQIRNAAICSLEPPRTCNLINSLINRTHSQTRGSRLCFISLGTVWEPPCRPGSRGRQCLLESWDPAWWFPHYSLKTCEADIYLISLSITVAAVIMKSEQLVSDLYYVRVREGCAQWKGVATLSRREVSFYLSRFYWWWTTKLWISR